MSSSMNQYTPNALHRRLLNDIAELHNNPYPNIHLHIDDKDMHKACLILKPEAYEPLHLLIEFPFNYPLRAPKVTMQSDIVHPNVFGDYICASILNTDEGWTPAYTLKSVLTQLLSFFSSDSVEQTYGYKVSLARYRKRRRPAPRGDASFVFSCDACGFGPGKVFGSVSKPPSEVPTAPPAMVSKLLSLPDEVVLTMLEEMPTKDILALAKAVPFIRRTINSYDFIRTRELQCFCLKKSYMEAKLGIGISVTGGRKPVLRSEFDLMSQQAFFVHEVRRSVQGVRFDKWLPLPLSRRHWTAVQANAKACLKSIHSYANMTTSEPEDVDVLYNLMNGVVVQFSTDAEKDFARTDERSTLNHASEKAVEAYYACFHLLLCLVTEKPGIVRAADRTLARFLTGPRTKTHFPDLGLLLVAALISDTGLTEPLTKLIIKEAILRNVVWMLDSQGADKAELAYLEPDIISDYRLTYTFAASRTSYRLLMFLKLFSAAVRPAGASLVEIRDALFDSHGAPPPGLCIRMVQEIKAIRDINGFPAFLRAMGVGEVPSKSVFTAYLRRAILNGVKIGYSIMPMSQAKLYMIRKVRENTVGLAKGVVVTRELVRWYDAGEKWYWRGWRERPSFFPAPSVKRRGEAARRETRW